MKKYILAAAISIMMLILLPACADSSKEPVDSAPPSAEGTEVPPSAEATEEAEKTELSEQRQKAAKYMEDQKAAEAAIQAELENGGYTFEDPLVVVNPYSLSPLSAVVGFDTDEETRIDVTIKGKDAHTDISHSFEELSTRHLLPIYGLYAGYDNTVELTATTQDGQSRTTVLTIRTDALPDDISQVEVRVAAPEKMTAGLTFVDSPNLNANYRYAFDCNGDIRWYISDKTFSGTLMLLHLKNGNFLIPSGDLASETAVDSLICFYEMTPLGKFVKEYQTHGSSVHHDARELPNGNLLFTASKEGRDTRNDYIIELGRETGEQVRNWDLKEIIPMTAYKIVPPYLGGDALWLHNNAVWYLEDEDAFIVSGRDQDLVMKFDAATKEIRWILSETVGEENEKVRPYLLTPVEDGGEFEYPTGQHAAMQTPEGDLLLFDNRNQDVLDANGTVDQSRLYSRAVRYEIDEENMTVKQVWQYGKERGSELYSSVVSDVDYLGPEHYLIDFGGIASMTDGSGCDLFISMQEYGAAKKESVVVEVYEDEVVFEVLISGGEGINANTYKAERADIYQNARDLLAE